MSNMPENTPHIPDISNLEYWIRHYDQTGSAKIEVRRKTYDATPSNQRFDPDYELYAALDELGEFNKTEQSHTNWYLDAGSGRPFTHQYWRLQQVLGRLVSLDPSISQITRTTNNSVSVPQEYRNVTHRDNEAGIRSYMDDYRAGLIDDTLPGIGIIKGESGNSPFEDNTFRVVSHMFSMGALDINMQEQAVLESKRVLLPETGKLVMGLAGYFNKPRVHNIEVRTSGRLSENTGRLFTPPQPPNTLFTADEAYLLLTQHFEHVYSLEHKADILIGGIFDEGVIVGSLLSFSDKYLDEKGLPPSPAELWRAMYGIIGQELLLARTSPKPLVFDTSHRVLIIASDSPLPLSDKFKLISKADASRIYSEIHS